MHDCIFTSQIRLKTTATNTTISPNTYKSSLGNNQASPQEIALKKSFTKENRTLTTWKPLNQTKIW